jgi:hypothetical protein
MCGYANIIGSKDSKINMKPVRLGFKNFKVVLHIKEVTGILVANKL